MRAVCGILVRFSAFKNTKMACKLFVLTNRNLLYKNKVRSLFNGCVFYDRHEHVQCRLTSCIRNVDHNRTCMSKKAVYLQERFSHRKRISDKRQEIMKDLKETRDKMKDHMGMIIKRENIWTIPNLLCMGRIAAAPCLSLLVVNGYHGACLLLFAIAGVTDVLDGWIARNVPGQSSSFGSFLDPLADKVLVATLFLSLTGVGLIPLPLTALVLSRDICLVAAGFYIRYQSLPPPRTLSRYFNASHATAQIAPTLISKVNTAVQLSLVGATLSAAMLGLSDHTVLKVAWYVTAGTTVASFLSYVIAKDTYKFFKGKDRYR